MSLKTVLEELGYEKHILDENTSYYKPVSGKSIQSFADEISHSLSQDLKSIHPKFFYNDKGSELFEKISHLPEYYLTRTEISILKKLQNDLPRFLDGDFRLVELGSGSSKKTRLILDVLNKIQKKSEYVSIDISNIIQTSLHDLQTYYDNLNTVGIIATYESGLEFVKEYDNKQNLIAFLGSSFGNFEQDAGIEFLHKIHSTMKDNDLFLIGLDLVKDKEILEKAYDDSQGVTAEFNLNVLSRINEPVCNVSFYEANAYCKWAGKRLPSEAEWEKAACYNEEKQQKMIFPWGNDKPTTNHANLLESYLWSPSEIGSYPDGTSPAGCHQMIGDVWEWTTSEFVGYPGFKPAFSEYNDKWFTNQKVLRGGSFGTPQISIRGSYRNFFRLDERWMFAGFRCAKDF